MAGALEFGAVLFCEDFKFEDGGESNKLLVVLGAKSGKNVIAALVTSKPKGGVWTEGCHAEKSIYHCKKGGKNTWPKDTWIQLYRLVEMSAAELVQLAMVKKTLITRANLPKETAAAIRNCAKRCEDVSADHIELME
jgi:hypothetical protein